MKTLIILSLFCISLTAASQTRGDHLAAVSNYLELLFEKGDFATLSQIIPEKATYTQAAGLPYGGVYTGFDEWAEMFTRIQGYCQVQLIDEPILYASADNNIIANFTVRFKSRKTGNEMEIRVCEVFGLEAGQIMSIRPYYFDTKAVAEFIGQAGQ